MFNPEKKITAIKGVLLSPFYYHGHYAIDGSATNLNVITDTAMCFALKTAFAGLQTCMKAKPDYRNDLATIPWRASLMLGNNKGLPPVRHSIDVSKEGGLNTSIQKNMGSGYYKNIFFVNEVAAGAVYHGALYGIDPFNNGNEECDHIILRIGVGKQGLLAISKVNHSEVKDVRLNTSTGKLFGRSIKEDQMVLDSIRVSQPYSLNSAKEELSMWV